MNATKISRLYNFVPGVSARSAQINEELNQVLLAYNNTVDKINLGVDVSLGQLESDVLAANTSANAAVVTANGANVKADASVVTANESVVTANAAYGKADAAVLTANTALGQDTVLPYTGALGAMKVATDVETAWLLAETNIAQAVIDANNAVAAVELKVDKEYVDQLAANFILGVVSDGSITDAKLSDTAGQIKGVVAAHVGDATVHFLKTDVSKADVGLANVANVLQESKSDADTHKGNTTTAHGINTKAVTALYSGTLTSAGWTGSTAPYSQTITVTGVASTDTPVIDMNLSGAANHAAELAMLEDYAKVYRIVTGTNEITAYAKEKPTVNIALQIKVVR